MYDEGDNKIVDNELAWTYSSATTPAPIPSPYSNYFGLTGYKHTMTTVVKNDYIFYLYKYSSDTNYKRAIAGFYFNPDNKFYQYCPVEYKIFGYYNKDQFPDSIAYIKEVFDH